MPESAVCRFNVLLCHERRDAFREALVRARLVPSAVDPGPARPARPERARLSSLGLFSDAAVWHIRIEVPAEGMNSLRSGHRTYVRATVREGTNAFNEMAVRLKGSTGGFRPLDDKPAFTVSCDRFKAGQRFHGLSRFQLNNSVEDPSYLSEKLGSELSRAAGVPAPRVSHARVELNGRKLGLYVLKEGFAEEFLARHFPRADGNLYEVEAGMTADVVAGLKRNAAPAVTDRSDLERLAAAAQNPNTARRWTALNEVMDMDRFLAFIAMEVLSGHRDGYGMAGNNFRLYHDPASQKFVFLPDGMDQLFGRADFPLHPRMAGLVAKALLETDEGRAAYRERLGMVFTNCFKVDVLTNRIREWSAALAPHLDHSEARTLQRKADALGDRIRQRALGITRQLAAQAPAPLHFENRIAHLRSWIPADPPEGGKLEQVTALDAPPCTFKPARRHRHRGARECGWAPGRYRFEGSARTKGVKAQSFGRTHGASMGLTGRKVSGARTLAADANWTELQAGFVISDPETEVELVCMLRASAGDVWFDLDSLRLVRVDESSDKQRP